jgi:GTP pyrophosphokinase
LNERVFVFTPKGEVIDLPTGATPIDFAYAVHTDVGNHIASATVNNKIAALDTTLVNGDIVHIETRTGAKPTRKWLESAATTFAKRKIRAELQKNTR